MWTIQEIPDAEVISPVTVLLHTPEFEQGLPKDSVEHSKISYSFYATNYTTDPPENQYITSQINDWPVLTAVTAPQFEAWKKAGVIAKRVLFVWKES